MRQVGLLLAGVWFVVHGLTDLADLSFRYDHLVTGGLAVAAGIFLIIRR